jgi:hypothetical protein
VTAPGGAERENLLREHLANPFLVLELPPDVPRGQLERQGAKLLALLAAGVAGSDSYPTPLGLRPRTAEMIRAALAELRDPDRRLRHEWWARGWAPHPPGEGESQREYPRSNLSCLPSPGGWGGDGRGAGGEGPEGG